MRAWRIASKCPHRRRTRAARAMPSQVRRASDSHLCELRATVAPSFHRRTEIAPRRRPKKALVVKTRCHRRRTTASIPCSIVRFPSIDRRPVCAAEIVVSSSPDPANERFFAEPGNPSRSQCKLDFEKASRSALTVSALPFSCP